MSLQGKNIAITGKLFLGRKQLIDLIESNGGTFSSSITENTTHLVCSDPSSSSTKLVKARAKGIEIVDEDFLKKLVNTKKRSASPGEKKQDAKRVKPEVTGDGETSAEALAGKVIAITGTLSRPRAHFESLIVSNGGTYADSLTKSVTHLVAADPDAASNKLEKARKNGTVIVGEDFFKNLSSLAAESPPALAPRTLLNEGDAVTVQGSSGSSYEIRLRNGVYYCTCPAWRMQKHSVDKRTCKHMRQLLGEDFEARRTKEALPAIPVPKSSKPELLLARKFEEEVHDPTGWHVSEKLDGVRAFWNGKNFISRLGNVFYAPDWFVADLPRDLHLDGELYMARSSFQQTAGIVKSANASEQWRRLKFMVFDIPSLESVPFEERIHTLDQVVATKAHVEVVEHEICSGHAHLKEKLETVERLGGEGLMLRMPGSKYERRRSPTLLKVKSWHDDEAIVVGYGTKGKGRLAGMTGSLKVKNRNGAVFNVGTGLSDAQRRNPPQPGEIITYKYQELTDAGIPRFPVFIGVAVDKAFP